MADLAPALTALAIGMFVVMAVMVTLSKRTRDRAQQALLSDGTPQAKGRSKRQQQVLDSLSQPPDIPTIEELVAEEAAATGVNDIAGGNGLDVSLKLRVYWRDEVVRRGCEDGHLEFRVDEGIDFASAETDDVRLVCVRDDASPAAAAEATAAVKDDDTANEPTDADATDRGTN
jgi:hypothetical protein